MKIQVLVSTMNDSEDIVNRLNILSEYIIINQCDKNSIINNLDSKFINSTEKGLSISRNMAIQNSNADICVLCDNDVYFYEDYIETIEKAYINNSKYDMLIFAIDRVDKTNLKTNRKIKKINYLNSMKMSSIGITFKNIVIKNKNIIFDNKFGAGSKYSMGEDNIFLYDCLKKGLKIGYIPVKIAKLVNNQSTWFNGFNEKYFYDKGAIFFRMTKKHYFILNLYFAFKFTIAKKTKLGFIKILQLMKHGKDDYKKVLKKEINY